MASRRLSRSPAALLSLIALALLTLSLGACGEEEFRGFTPGSESLNPQAPISRAERDNPDRQQPNVGPASATVSPPPTPPAVSEMPFREASPAPTPLPTPAARPTPTLAPPKPKTPVELTLTLADDQARSSSPTATWVAGNPSRVSHYELALGASMGRAEVLDWKNLGAATSYRAEDGVDGINLTLEENRDYYLSLRALGHEGAVVGKASSQAWFVHTPYVFDARRYSSVTKEAPNSFWGVRHPDPRYAQWDDSLEAYVIGSGAIDLYHELGGRALTGSPEVKILQTERGFPSLEDVIQIGEGEVDSSHADAVASMLYGCEVAESRRSYHRGCQVNPQKYAMTSKELGDRLDKFVLTSQNADTFESHLFGEMGAPHVWSMAHAHPTSVQREGDYDRDQITGLRLGDWIFSRYNILAVSPQPGSYAGRENPNLSGNYYNSIVVGKKSYNYTYPAQSSIDNTNGPRHKPDIVVAASNLAEASSWSTGTLASAASALLGLALTDPNLAGAAHMQTMKAIILAGAGKDHLCPESIIEAEGFCNGLPQASKQWQWSNTESAPLDPTYGAGLFNYRNSFDILTAGRSTGGRHSKDVGWDSQQLADGQQAAYTFTANRPNDAFSLALAWNRDISVDDEGALASHLADFKVELRNQDGEVVGRSDDPGNNIEHIYLTGGLTVGETYTITVTLKSAEFPVRYGLAWEARDTTRRHELWREE